MVALVGHNDRVAVTRVLVYLLGAGLGVSVLGLIVLAVGGVAGRRARWAYSRYR